MSALLGLPGGREEPAGRSLVGLASSEDTVNMSGHLFNHCAVLTLALASLGVVEAACGPCTIMKAMNFHWILMVFIDF